MAWTAPVDRTTGYVVSAADYNAIEDNLTFLAGTKWATVATVETTASLSYTDLATSGPAVTVTTGANALITVSAISNISVQGDGAAMSAAVSGATTIAASDTNRAQNNNNQNASVSCTSVIGGLNAGANTFTAKYKAVVGGTATYANRWIAVTPLP